MILFTTAALRHLVHECDEAGADVMQDFGGDRRGFLLIPPLPFLAASRLHLGHAVHQLLVHDRRFLQEKIYKEEKKK